MITTRVKEKLEAGKPVYGSFVKANEPGMVEAFGYAGFDFVILDGEHGRFGFAEAEQLARAADCAGISPIMRISGGGCEIEHALDIGAAGVMVPAIECVSQARVLAPHAKYAPAGVRGASLDQRSADYGFCDTARYFREANQNTMLILQVESAGLLGQLDDFLTIPQLDMVFIGPADLSAACGKPGQLECKEVQNAIQMITEASLKHNIAVGIFAATIDQAKKYRQLGIQLIAYCTDFMLYGKILRDTMKQLKEI